MTKRRVLIIVEGPHDEAVVGQMIALRRPPSHAVILKSKVDSYWQATIPRQFPQKDDLRARMEVPSFYESEDVSVAVICAGSVGAIAGTLQRVIAIIEPRPASIGIVLDADSTETPLRRYSRLRDSMNRLTDVGIAWPDELGTVSGGAPDVGVFILPDNANSGTLEDLLLEAATIEYGAMIAAATSYVDNAPTATLSEECAGHFSKPAGRKKAVVASVGAVLRPGKAIQVSIRDNRWITEQVLQSVPRMATFFAFLCRLLGDSGSPAAVGPEQSPSE